MSDKRRDDLDWLYGRTPEPEDQDATQVFGAQPDEAVQRPSDSIYRSQERPRPEPVRQDPAPTAQMPVWQQPQNPGQQNPGQQNPGQQNPGQQQGRQQAPYQGAQQPGRGTGGYGRPPMQPGNRGPGNPGLVNGPSGNGGMGRGGAGNGAVGGATSRPSGRRRRKLHPVRWLLVLLLAYLVFLVVTPMWFFTRGNTIDAASPEPLPNQPGEVILLVGSDARTNLTDEQKRKYGTGSAEGARTDTIMLLFLPKKGKPSLISLPRDLRVTVPGHGHDKLNAAFAYGGPKLLTQTIEKSTGVQVDGYLQIGMVGFAEAVDAVGGIEMCLDKPMVDKDSHANFPAGCQTFDGKDALAYVRMRKADPTGDLGRTKRQREVIGKIAKKAMSPATLLPWRYWDLNKVASQLLVRGTNTSLTTEARAMMSFLSISKGDGHQFVIPIGNPAANYGGVSYVTWDKERASALFESMQQGSSEGFEQYQRR